ncbi:1,2-phenylacetyl-CoA epoxidase subunit PaaA [Natrarchaeobius chitinivorans]|uniref:1,2-phenylacetyl-CoA epoxidase subunit A n=1 Tax=Natrarchaeobius chitinivorans TaxID=1679083 RepID=A0A3N6MDY5_NATCH|nr:1,2-phenylacetyl-CoA epoxidase subunit PaaA [Natrarchaeobius chitinivorans]RQG94830.1 1,2-phenylacetyl-CoA epoxidase subunit A [Natrarchaeobius chitinivorans]
MELEERIAEGQTIEPTDDLTDEYERLVSRIVQFTANSELIGAFTERPMIERAPNYHRKLALLAKNQDEIGHALMQYRIAEDLGRDREQMLEDLLDGKVGYGSSMQFPVDDWIELTAFTCLTDGAAMILQHSLLQTSYGPYARVMRRICREEEFHLRHGRDLLREYATGTRAQQEAMQEAVDRWWPRGMLFFGPTDDEQSDAALRMYDLGIRTKSNDELRQDYLDFWVPKLDELGLEIPDDKLEYDEEAGEWSYTEPSMEMLEKIRTEGGPAGQRRLDERRRVFDDTKWVRDALAAHNDRATNRIGDNLDATAD